MGSNPLKDHLVPNTVSKQIISKLNIFSNFIFQKQQLKISVAQVFGEHFIWVFALSLIFRHLMVNFVSNSVFQMKVIQRFLKLWCKNRLKFWYSMSRLGWFTAYLGNVFLTKLQDPKGYPNRIFKNFALQRLFQMKDLFMGRHVI